MISDKVRKKKERNHERERKERQLTQREEMKGQKDKVVKIS